jgi:hypothetical protein
MQWWRRIRWFFVVPGFVLTLLGFAFLPKDISELPSAFEWWGAVMDYVGRDNALIAFSAVLVAWILWMEVRPAVFKWLSARNVSPLELSITGGGFYVEDGRFLTPLVVRNTSRSSIEDVEVYLQKISLRHNDSRGYRPINKRLVLKTARVSRFHLSPLMPRELSFMRKTIADDETSKMRLEFGPFEDRSTSEFGPGLYKVDLAAYGKNIPAMEISFAIAANEDGGGMMGLWREDEVWPFVSRTKITEVPSTPEKDDSTDESGTTNG